MANVGCRIRKEFERPDRKLVEAFKDIPVANIDDCMNRTAAVDSQLKPMNKARLLGTAFTVKAPAGDNLMFHKALDMAKPGDVLVIATFGSQSRSLCGEIMTRYAMSKGLAGFVVDASKSAGSTNVVSTPYSGKVWAQAPMYRTVWWHFMIWTVRGDRSLQKSIVLLCQTDTSGGSKKTAVLP